MIRASQPQRQIYADSDRHPQALIRPLIPPAKRGGGKRTVSMREMVNGLMYVLATGCLVGHFGG
jgi:transposase